MIGGKGVLERGRDSYDRGRDSGYERGGGRDAADRGRERV